MTDNQDHTLTIRNTYERINREVNYSLDQMQKSSERKGVRGWCKWKVFIEAPKEIQEKIKHVEYELHPSFNPRYFRSVERDKNFALNSIGWGEFDITIAITFTNNKTLTGITHYLDLVNGGKTNVKIDENYLGWGGYPKQYVKPYD